MSKVLSDQASVATSTEQRLLGHVGLQPQLDTTVSNVETSATSFDTLSLVASTSRSDNETCVDIGPVSVSSIQEVDYANTPTHVDPTTFVSFLPQEDNVTALTEQHVDFLDDDVQNLMDENEHVLVPSTPEHDTSTSASFLMQEDNVSSFTELLNSDPSAAMDYEPPPRAVADTEPSVSFLLEEDNVTSFTDLLSSDVCPPDPYFPSSPNNIVMDFTVSHEMAQTGELSIIHPDISHSITNHNTPIIKKRFRSQQNKCSTPFSTKSPTPKKTASVIQKIINKPSHLPLSKLEEKLFTKFVKVKLSKSEKGKPIKANTGGQPILLMKVVKPRKKSSLAKSPLKRKRARDLKKIRSVTAGGGSSDDESQRVAELKVLPMKRKRRISEKAGVKKGGYINNMYGLAIKAETNITWSQLRRLKRLLKPVGVTFENETKQREAQQEFLPPMAAETLKGTVPFLVCYVEDFCKFTKDLLNRYQSADMLTWHDGHIPDDEVWVKVGGDYGKKSFKFALELLNCENPNSPKNTYPLLVANVKDTSMNLVVTMEKISPQITDLQSLVWNGKKVRLFLFGDYEFLAKVYGHQGATSRYACLWCLSTRADMDRREKGPKRTLDSIKKDFKRFVKQGKGKLLKSKHYNNIVRKPLLTIPLDHVCPPYLHMLLGIVKKEHENLENNYNVIDMEAARQGIAELKSFPPVNEAFDQYMKTGIELVEQNYDIQSAFSCFTFDPDMDPGDLAEKLDIDVDGGGDILDMLYDKFVDNEDLLEDHSSEYPLMQGPLCASLENVLQQNRIVRQAYHSQSFIGNHCHKYLTAECIESLTSTIRHKSVDLFSRYQPLITKTLRLSEKNMTILKAFSLVHQLMSHKKPMQDKDNEVRAIEDAISNYFDLYQALFPDISLIPKQHFLEHHCTDWIRRWGFGMAFGGEQGGEHIHAHMHRIARSSKGILNEVDRIKYTMKESITLNAPEIRKLVPEVKKRQPKRKKNIVID